MSVRPIEILLAEDNPADVRLVREALREHKLLLNLSVVENGEDAMAFLHRQPPFGNAARPDLVMLDLNIPRLDGREVLTRVKADEALRRIPVVVLTSSAAESDILKAYNLGANCYITKPVGFAEFGDVIKAIDAFWFTVVRLPDRD